MKGRARLQTQQSKCKIDIQRDIRLLIWKNNTGTSKAEYSKIYPVENGTPDGSV